MASFPPCTKGLSGLSGCSLLLWLHRAKRFSHRPHPVNPANESWWHHSTAAVRRMLPSPAAVSRAHHMTLVPCRDNSVGCTLSAFIPGCRLHWWPCKGTGLCFPRERRRCAPALTSVSLTAAACVQSAGCCGLLTLRRLSSIAADRPLAACSAQVGLRAQPPLFHREEDERVPAGPPSQRWLQRIFLPAQRRRPCGHFAPDAARPQSGAAP